MRILIFYVLGVNLKNLTSTTIDILDKYRQEKNLRSIDEVFLISKKIFFIAISR